MEGEMKTRNLSVAEYYQQVQKEYLIADFRRKVYFSPKDKEYWKRVVAYKEKRIKDISERNGLKSILNDKEKYAELKSMLFDSKGKPKFELTKDDVRNYYSVGNEFGYNGDIYILDQFTADGKLTLYSVQKEEYVEVDQADVWRIL